MAELVGKYMQEADGIRFIKGATVDSITLDQTGRKVVNYLDQQETFDTVLYATGREIDTDQLIDQCLGVEMNMKNKKIITNDNEETNVKGLYAIGDCAEGRPELTPPAIRAGKLLAQRLFGGSQELMDYKLCPTTVFTPLEYSCCGLSEEEAEA